MLITTKKGKGDKIHIYVNDEYKMTVDEAYWLSLGIAEKSCIDEESYGELEANVIYRRAFNKGVDILALREHSRRELVEKLMQRGYNKEIAEATADKLASYGYIDDERFAFLYARELKQRKKFGKGRIRQELMRKGIERDVIDAVLEEVEEEPQEEIKAILLKKYPNFRTDEKIKNRAINALIRYGYRIQDIKNTMNTFDNAEEEYYDV